jgi:hypothetical protein
VSGPSAAAVPEVALSEAAVSAAAVSDAIVAGGTSLGRAVSGATGGRFGSEAGGIDGSGDADAGMEEPVSGREPDTGVMSSSGCIAAASSSMMRLVAASGAAS